MYGLGFRAQGLGGLGGEVEHFRPTDSAGRVSERHLDCVALSFRTSALPRLGLPIGSTVVPFWGYLIGF